MSEICDPCIMCYQLKQLKKQPEKNSGLNEIQTHAMTLQYRCNALSTDLPSHMDRWSIVSLSYTQ